MGALFPVRFKPRPDTIAKDFRWGPIRPANGDLLRGWLYFDPVFCLEVGQTRICGVRGFVGNPKAYGGAFQRGDRIVVCHFFSRNPKEAFRLLVESGKILPMLRDAGYKGIYGDTTNGQLLRVFMRHSGYVIEPPAYKNVLTRIAVALLALWNLVPERYLDIGYGIPLNFLGRKFQRLIIRL